MQRPSARRLTHERRRESPSSGLVSGRRPLECINLEKRDRKGDLSGVWGRIIWGPAGRRKDFGVMGNH